MTKIRDRVVFFHIFLQALLIVLPVVYMASSSGSSFLQAYVPVLNTTIQWFQT
jgi:hypothetical protein